MGNSQSIDKVQHVVKQGISIYEKVKKEQEQQEHQQQNHNNNHSNYNNHSSSGGGSSYHPSADVDDDEHYSQLRAQAHEEAEKRNDCYARSQEAYKNGDGSEGNI
jgi:hypothetical protein